MTQPDDSEPVEPRLINRCAIMLEPTAAFVEWINACDPEGEPTTLEELADERTVYLLPKVDDPSDALDWVKENYQFFLEEELYDWYTAESMWPKNRSLKTFEKFFTVRFHSMIVDMDNSPIEWKSL